MERLRPLIGLLAPPRCVACGRGCDDDSPLCRGCAKALGSLRPSCGPIPAGVDAAWSAAPHEGLARDLVVALKFGRLLAAAEPIAAAIARAPSGVLAGTLVAVPAAPMRRLWRGFDPAEEIAARLAAITGLPRSHCLRRRDGPRQVGRPRRQRVASPPAIECAGRAPAQTVLVDDVRTTGATLAACAAALRKGDARRVCAATFAWAP